MSIERQGAGGGTLFTVLNMLGNWNYNNKLFISKWSPQIAFLSNIL